LFFFLQGLLVKWNYPTRWVFAEEKYLTSAGVTAGIYPSPLFLCSPSFSSISTLL
jgi:hypothetical protein